MAGTDVVARTGQRQGDPAFWLLMGQLVMFTGVAAVFPIAPLYVAHRGGNSVAVAIFIAGPLVANTLVQVPAGRLCDRWGRKPFLVGPRLVYAVLAFFLFFNIGTLPVLTALRVLMGACAGAYVPALRAALTDLSDPDQRAQRFSQLQAYEMVGLLVGPLIGGAAALWQDSAVFGVTGLAMFIGIGPMLRVPETRAAPATSVVEKERFRWWRLRGIVVPIAVLFAVGTIWSMYDVVWPQYLAARGNSPLIIGLSVSLFALPILLLARAGGRLADRVDRRKLVTAGLLVVAVCASTYPFLRILAVILVIGAIEAVATVILEPSLFAVIGDSTPEALRGRAMGLGGLYQFSGMAFGAAVLGSLYGVNAGLPFWCGAGILLCGALVCSAWLPGRPGLASHVIQPAAFPVLEREQG
ncbi:MAG TPA: MFS transporter [Candidatus Saccharimonadales bacterium]|nr:MFS transporter [Candidatus Saccharimonadales bacterium]